MLLKRIVNHSLNNFAIKIYVQWWVFSLLNYLTNPDWIELYYNKKKIIKTYLYQYNRVMLILSGIIPSRKGRPNKVHIYDIYAFPRDWVVIISVLVNFTLSFHFNLSDFPLPSSDQSSFSTEWLLLASCPHKSNLVDLHSDPKHVISNCSQYIHLNVH